MLQRQYINRKKLSDEKTVFFSKPPFARSGYECLGGVVVLDVERIL